MPRRRLEPPPAERLAAILGMPSAAPSPGVSQQLVGWVPLRTSLTRPRSRPDPPGALLGAPVPVSLAPAVFAPVATTPSAARSQAATSLATTSQVVSPGLTLAMIPTARVPTPLVATQLVASPQAATSLVASPQAATPLVASPQVATPQTGRSGSEGDGRHRRPAPPKPAILTIPVALRGVRAKPRRLAVLGVLVLLVAAAVVLGLRVAWARSASQPRPVAAAAHGPPGGLATRTVPAAFASKGSAGLPATAAVLVVHVVGQVHRPGVVRLPPGSRVLDALTAAGGSTPSADLNHLNLARPVADGEQIVVPKPGESVAGGTPGSAGGAPGAAGPGSAGAGSAGGLVDLNTADATALDSLPGVGPVIAQRILDWRTEHGRFSSVDELGEVTGIGDKLMAQIGPKVRV